jgi:hypothetical protein
MQNLFSSLSSRAQNNKLNRNEYFRVALILFLFIGLVVMLTLEIKHFSNTFGVKQMLLISIVVGLLLGFGLWSYFVHKNPDMELLTKFQLCLALLFGGSLLMPPLTSFTNRTLSFAEPQQVPVIFYKSEGYYANRYGILPHAKPDGYYVFFVKDDQLERIKVRENLFPDAVEGAEVLLPVNQGAWGFDFVDF